MPNCDDGPAAKHVQQKRRAMKARRVTFVVKKDPERGYNACAIGHSIFTQADTVKEMKAMIREAVKCHFDPGERPSRIRVRFPRKTILL
jgi:hypothetical protein